jgi:3-phosphoshikimate 1-carboxyvinyltransferase
LEGQVSVPGDKSISHRTAILASLAEGTSTIAGYATGADCQSTLNCIRRLGVAVEQSPDTVTIHGEGLYGYRPASLPASLDVGNSGSTIRMMSGVLAAQKFVSILDGDSSIRRRPMSRIIKPLQLMGARIDSQDNGLPPLTIHGGALHPIDYSSPISSAQVKSCVLLAGLFAEGTTSFAEPADSRNHTELMLPHFGAHLRIEDRRISVKGPASLVPVSYKVPGDFSSAAFFVAAAAMRPGSKLVVKSVNLNPTRTGFLEVIESLGADIERINVREEHGEIVGDLCISGSALRSVARGTVIRGEIIPRIIDELPVLAVLATQTEGRIEVRDARELRVKETDRVKAIANGIRAMSGVVEEFEDGFAISGPQKLVGGRTDAKGDHRIAMALSIAALSAEGRTDIAGADCVGISFPEFFDILRSVLKGASVE